MRVGIVGAGAMGSAIAHALEGALLCDPKAPSDFSDVSEMLPHVDLLFLAIKPKHFTRMPASEKLIVSVMAGVSITAIKEKTGAARVIRTMPNLGVSLGEGVIGWYATSEVSDEEKRWAIKAFRRMGREVEVEHEELLDGVTAISGSGPAYFFHLTEELARAAKKLGFSEEQARLLAEGALNTSHALLRQGTAKEWRERVTSAGGTTEAALQVLQKSPIGEAVEAAYKKAKELHED